VRDHHLGDLFFQIPVAHAEKCARIRSSGHSLKAWKMLSRSRRRLEAAKSTQGFESVVARRNFFGSLRRVQQCHA